LSVSDTFWDSDILNARCRNLLRSDEELRLYAGVVDVTKSVTAHVEALNRVRSLIIYVRGVFLTGRIETGFANLEPPVAISHISCRVSHFLHVCHDRTLKTLSMVT